MAGWYNSLAASSLLALPEPLREPETDAEARPSMPESSGVRREVVVADMERVESSPEIESEENDFGSARCRLRASCDVEAFG